MCSACRALAFPQPRQITEVDAAWIAGVLEGEGCWTTKNGRSSWTVAVRMTDRDIVERLALLTGIGRLSREESTRGHKTAWIWQVCARPHREWLTLRVWPWLGSRRRARIKELWPEIEDLLHKHCGDVLAFQAS
jgi:hypothetical protein